MQEKTWPRRASSQSTYIGRPTDDPCSGGRPVPCSRDSCWPALRPPLRVPPWIGWCVGSKRYPSAPRPRSAACGATNSARRHSPRSPSSCGAGSGTPAGAAKSSLGYSSRPPDRARACPERSGAWTAAAACGCVTLSGLRYSPGQPGRDPRGCGRGEHAALADHRHAGDAEALADPCDRPPHGGRIGSVTGRGPKSVRRRAGRRDPGRHGRP